MTFELDSATIARRDAARAVAADVVAAAATAADAGVGVPDRVRDVMRGVMPSPVDGVAWVVVLETLAATSPALALAAAADALGVDAATDATQWSGLRGLDVDGVGTALAGQPGWHLAVSAALVGAAAASVAAGVAALKAAKAAGTLNGAGQPIVADAATAVDAVRLLLLDAALRPAGSDARVLAAGLARLQALDAVTTAMRAAEVACGAGAFRPGAALERLRRDAVTLAQVLGDAAGAQAAVAAATLPA